MPNIDAHQHFWKYNPVVYPWIDDRMQTLKQDFLPQDLQPLLEKAGFEGCVAVQACQEDAETEWLLELAREHAFIRGVVGWTDLCDPACEKKLAQLAAHTKLVGIRHILQDEPDDTYMLREPFLHGISLLATYNLTYDLLVYPRQLAYAIQLVEKFPQQKWVLDHLGKPPIKTSELEPWRSHIYDLASHTSVYCKLSGMATEADWASWTVSQFLPYLEIVVDAFGWDRLMIGSDWPVCLLAADYLSAIQPVLHLLSKEPISVQNSVLGKNALDFYCLSSS